MNPRDREQMSVIGFDAFKQSLKNTNTKLKYKLKNAVVFASKGEDFHCTAFFDETAEVDPSIRVEHEDARLNCYIREQLECNQERFDKHANLTSAVLGCPLSKRVLDVGCGGGCFLSLMKSMGSDVVGIELSNERAFYASRYAKVQVSKIPIESPKWAKSGNSFDAVTLWDVIEHVNFPELTLASCVSVLKPGGALLIDTPCRDSFFYKIGQFSYKLSMGRFPTFLNTMYSNHPFGHKQIFTKKQIVQIIKACGCDVTRLEQFHELSFPIEFYIEKLIPVRALRPVVAILSKMALRVLPVKNKMLVVAIKKQL